MVMHPESKRLLRNKMRYLTSTLVLNVCKNELKQVSSFLKVQIAQMIVHNYAQKDCMGNFYALRGIHKSEAKDAIIKNVIL